MQNAPRGFVAINNDLTFDTRLTPQARTLYVLLMTYAPPATGVATVTREVLAELMGTTTRTVSRYAAELEAAGWIDRKGTTYTLHETPLTR